MAALNTQPHQCFAANHNDVHPKLTNTIDQITSIYRPDYVEDLALAAWLRPFQRTLRRDTQGRVALRRVGSVDRNSYNSGWLSNS